MLVKHVGHTLSNIVRWCWMLFDQCWIVLNAGVFKRIQHHPTMLDFSTRHEIMAYFWSRERKCWTMLNKTFEQSHWLYPTLSNTIQHVWLCCSNGSKKKFNVWPTCLIRLNGPLGSLKAPKMLRPLLFRNMSSSLKNY